MEQLLTPVMRYTRVYSTAYANLPAVGIRPESLGYATDRKTLYRWSGLVWEPLTIYASSGAIGDIPAAADLPDGSLYYGTDTGLLYQVQTATWVVITSVEWALLDTQTITSGQTTKTLTFAAHDLIRVEYHILFTNTADGSLLMRLNAIATNDYGARRFDGNAVTVTAAQASCEVLDFLKDRAVVGELLITGRHSGVSGRKSFCHRGTPIDFDDLCLIDGQLRNDANDLTTVTLYCAGAAEFEAGAILAYGKNL